MLNYIYIRKYICLFEYIFVCKAEKKREHDEKKTKYK
jgi:hypothetical protein